MNEIMFVVSYLSIAWVLWVIWREVSALRIEIRRAHRDQVDAIDELRCEVDERQQ
jgi:hypothetical protein